MNEQTLQLLNMNGTKLFADYFSNIGNSENSACVVIGKLEYKNPEKNPFCYHAIVRQIKSELRFNLNTFTYRFDGARDNAGYEIYYMHCDERTGMNKKVNGPG